MDSGTIETPIAERRGFRRQALKLNKIFSAEVRIEGTLKRCYLYVLDISEGGMKITSHFSFPEKTPIRFKFFFEEPLEVTIERVWEKSIEGTQMMGIKFIEVTDEARAPIKRFMESFSPAEKRKSFRLDRVLSVEMDLGDHRQTVFAMTLDLSAGGMRITLEDAMPENRNVPCRIQLEYNKPRVEVIGRVAWQKPTSYETFLVGVEFRDPSPETVQRIDTYIDKAIAGLLDDQIPQYSDKDEPATQPEKEESTTQPESSSSLEKSDPSVDSVARDPRES